ncbi:MAG: transposase [Terracidiphilus sp.]
MDDQVHLLQTAFPKGERRRVAHVSEAKPARIMGAPGLDSETWESTDLNRPKLRNTLPHHRGVSWLAMTRGLIRYQQTGNFHFLTFSCFHRLPHLATPAARDLFELSLEQTRRQHGFVVAGYVVMPEHVHLLVSEPLVGSLARAIQALKISVARRNRQRPFWQARYYDFNVHNEEKRAEKLHYMHQNPVVRGLVEKPEDWQWSSFRHYASGHAGAVEIESQWTAARRGNQLPEIYRGKSPPG